MKIFPYSTVTKSKTKSITTTPKNKTTKQIQFTTITKTNTKIQRPY